MKTSYKWLKTLLPINESPEEIGKLLTGTGLEVEGIEEVETIKGGLRDVVIGEVLTCAKHPDADKLSITTVDVGRENPLDIVCGAPNVAVGQKVVVATVGATLHPLGSDQPLVIKKAKIRGAVSEGMICAEDELGTGTSHAGILVLDTDVPNGTPAAGYFGVESDHVFEIGLTPNRADAASHFGVARDLKAVLDRDIALPVVDEFAVNNHDLPMGVVVENAAAAPRYCGLTVSNLTVKESPEWLRQRLTAIGVRPINNVVDITNYVCHELGQPMHAFDAAAVTGNQIIVKTLPESTPFTTLDGVERKLAADDLMICNAEEPMCIAGVFGGTRSGVTFGTTAIFLESAYFSPDWIRRTAQRHSLKTDASFRYERGTDPNMPLFALKRAALLLKEIAGGVVSSDVVDLYPEPIADFVVAVKYSNINRLIGKELERSLIKSILEKLDIRIEGENEKGFRAIVPPYRVDVQREADIIEEILRIYGFDNVELSPALGSDYLSDFPLNDPDKLRLRCSETLAANGFFEIINNSLTKPEGQTTLADELPGEPVKILNYLSEDLSELRQTMLFGGLETLAYNVNRRQADLKLFEFGKTYHKKDGKYVEKGHLCVFITGDVAAESWFEKSRDVAFHDLAGAVQRVLTAMKVKGTETGKINNKIFQSGLELTLNKKTLVSLGLVQSALTKKAGLKKPVWYADLDWDYLLKQYSPVVQYEEVTRFPEVRRDLSLVLEKSVSFDQLKQIAHRTERKLLREVNVFDVFEGESLGGKKAYALSFILQDEQQTLTDKVIDKTMQRLMTSFEKDLGAVIRK
ncbi:phenylalanine--tRNA ligase subunit beta [Persicitalea jodogahamensis]|uniref:Phenylalanine--tRNA ligase beta subunit n=1 Tax=Persicitalea jodogahamensis TaxID=402147 RepID=A0A8J3D6T5_9BACT|nr:phenylalanine--tRNA ligase subunit beta [Persicitalea jodogahamensis]GHB58712.1 phenylalanine--tRNA ligase beta subunit [Persicitalea jodogahamensis]